MELRTNNPSVSSGRRLPRNLIVQTLAIALVPMGALHAATITVTSAEDPLIPLVQNEKRCTLRWAADAAFNNQPKGNCKAGTAGVEDLINFDIESGGQLLTLENGEIELRDKVKVDGGGTIELNGFKPLPEGGAKRSRIFRVMADSQVTLEGLVLKNGYADGDGGAVLGTGSQLTVRDSKFLLNEADGLGGAISFNGTLLLEHVKFFQNKAKGTKTRGLLNGGGGRGGALNAGGLATIKDSHFYRNRSLYGGGGIYCSYGQIQILNTALEANTTIGLIDPQELEYKGGGGALMSACRTISISNRFNGNSARGRGGGAVYILGATPTSLFEKTVMMNNTAGAPPADQLGYLSSNASGGAVLLEGPAVFSQSSIAYNVVHNAATEAKELGGGGGIAIRVASGAVTLVNTQVFDNQALPLGEANGSGIYVRRNAPVEIISSTISNSGRNELYFDDFENTPNVTFKNSAVLGKGVAENCGGALDAVNANSNYNVQSDDGGMPTCGDAVSFTVGNPAVQKNTNVTAFGQALFFPIVFNYIHPTGADTVLSGQGNPAICTAVPYQFDGIFYIYNIDILGQFRPVPCSIGAAEPE